MIKYPFDAPGILTKIKIKSATSLCEKLSHLIRSKELAANVPKLIPSIPSANTLSSNALMRDPKFQKSSFLKTKRNN